jgi:hypothetical protein
MIKALLKRKIEKAFCVKVESITDKTITVRPFEADLQHLNKELLATAVSNMADRVKVVVL